MMPPLERISLLRSQIEMLQAELPAVVQEARTAGCTWPAIAERLGVTKQAVQRRFGRKKRLSLPSDESMEPLFSTPQVRD